MVAQGAARWQDAEVVAVEDVADGVRGVVLRPERLVPAAPGSHVDVELEVEGRRLTRSYSVVGESDGLLTLGVRRAPHSRGGSRAMHALLPGDRIRVTQPLQGFPLGVGAGRYVLLAGGIGVTAVLAMAATLRRRGADYVLVQVARSRGVLAFADDLESHGDRLRLHLDDEGPALDAVRLVAEIADHDLAQDTELYMCGPIRLMDAVRREWTRRGLPRANLRFETFGSSGAWEPEEFTVSIADGGGTVRVPVDLSPLEALEAAGVAVMSDCRKGECGLCVVGVRGHEGRLDHRDVFLDDEQKAAGTKLCLCVSRVASAGAGPGALVIERP